MYSLPTPTGIAAGVGIGRTVAFVCLSALLQENGFSYQH